MLYQSNEMYLPLNFVEEIFFYGSSVNCWAADQDPGIFFGQRSDSEEDNTLSSKCSGNDPLAKLTLMADP